MNIDTNVRGTETVVALSGRLDTVTAPELEEALVPVMDQAESLTLDLEKLDYISSAGLRILLKTHKTMSQRAGMKLIHASEMVKDVLDVTGFSDILTIE